eukprot:350746-Chlamydomonas_euryale.AAC.2
MLSNRKREQTAPCLLIGCLLLMCYAQSSPARPLSAPQLNRLIKGCGSGSDLLSLVRSHGQQFDYIHVSTALVQASKLCCGQSPHSSDMRSAVDKLVRYAHQLVPKMKAQ